MRRTSRSDRRRRRPALALAAALLLASALPAGRAPGGEEGGADGGEPPASPFAAPESERPDAVPGRLKLSDGKVLRGRIFLTRDKRLELYSDAEKKWHKLKLAELSSLTWVVEFEKEEKEWRWKESGSDEKVLTGRVKVDRRYRTVAALKGGEKVEGHIRGTVIYVQPAEGQRRKFFLYWNHPSDFDQKPEDLVYVREILFGEEHAREPEKGGQEGKGKPGESDESDKSDRSDGSDNSRPPAAEGTVDAPH